MKKILTLENKIWGKIPSMFIVMQKQILTLKNIIWGKKNDSFYSCDIPHLKIILTMQMYYEE